MGRKRSRVKKKVVANEVKVESSSSFEVNQEVESDTSKNTETHDMDGMMSNLIKKNLQFLGKETKHEPERVEAQFEDVEDEDDDDDVEDEDDDDDEELEYVIQQREIFQPYACHICKATVSQDNTMLKRCVGCKMIAYCSKEHQKEHWTNHKDLCHVICKLCKKERVNHFYDKAVGLSANMFRDYRIQRMNDCIAILGRSLHLWEREMFYYTPACQTCYQVDRSQLITCDKCNHVNYCKIEHRNESHKTWCQALCLYRDIVFYQAKHGMIQPLLPNQLVNKTPLLQESNLNKFLLDVFGPKTCMQWNKMTYAVMSDAATCPLTILFGLQKCQVKIESRTHLVIHMVGAELHFEADTLKKYELLLLHLLPNLKTLHLAFIGPELQKRPPEMIDEKLCMQCMQLGKKVIYQFFPNCFYHDYITLQDYTKPDMICAFNAGLYRSTGFAGSDTWARSIEVMLNLVEIPLLVTAYTAEEIPKDLARMKEHAPKSLHFQTILGSTANPFCSSKPSLNFIDEENIPVIFKNYYIAIAKCTKSEKVMQKEYKKKVEY